MDERTHALDIARLRQGDAERRGFKPCGHGSVSSHIYGAAAEIAVAKLLGCPVPQEWDWYADKRRGCDLRHYGVPVHVRSSRKGDHFLWRPGRDAETGIWVFCDTSAYPVVSVAGWLSGRYAAMLGEEGYLRRSWLFSTAKLMEHEELRVRYA